MSEINRTHNQARTQTKMKVTRLWIIIQPVPSAEQCLSQLLSLSEETTLTQAAKTLRSLNE